MSQGQFTKQESDHVKLCITNMFDAIPKSKRYGYLGELNDSLL